MPATYTSRLEGVQTSVAVKAPCRVVATSAITLIGLQVIDGVTVASGDRVLVKGQSPASGNGIWNASATTWTRALDFDGSGDVVGGTMVLVNEGTTYQRTAWQVTGTGTKTVGQDSITFVAALGYETLAGSTGAGQVGFSHASGAAGTVAGKLRDSIDPKDAPYSAVGDNATNDLTALQTLLSDATALDIYASWRNTYRINSGLTLNRSNLRVRGLKLNYVPTANGAGLTIGTTTPDAFTTLTANSLAGDNFVTVSNTTGAAIGKLVLIQWRNASDYALDNAADARRHISRIIGNNATEVYFQDALGEGVSTSEIQSVAFFTPLTNLDLEIDMSQVSNKLTITAITKAAAAQITTSAAHGLTTGQIITINGPGSTSSTTNMFEIHGARAAVTVINSTTFTIPVNSTGYSTYVSGATACLEAHAFSLGAMDNCRLRLTGMGNDTAGAGILGFYLYDCDVEFDAQDCGNQVSAGISLFGVGQCEIWHRTSGSDGFGCTIYAATGCVVHNGGCSLALQGRGTKYGGGFGNTYYGGSDNNASFVGVAFAWGERSFNAFGFHAMGANIASVQNGGIWTSGCNVQGTLHGCSAANNIGYDLQVNATDVIETHGCNFGVVDNNGTLTMFGSARTARPTITGSGSTRFLFGTGLQLRSGADFPIITYSDNFFYNRAIGNAATSGQVGWVAVANDSGGLSTTFGLINVAGEGWLFTNSATSPITVKPNSVDVATFTIDRLSMAKPVKLMSYTFATLPASPQAGDMAFITDCNSATFNAAAAGGGANVVKVCYLGGSWRVA